MRDRYNRTLNYLRLSVTDRCNLRCQYCMPPEGILKFDHYEMLSLEELSQLVDQFVKLGVDKIRLTGGEPLVRLGILDLIRRIRRHPEIRDLSMTTNGVLLKKMASDLKNAGLDRVNISLDSLKPHKYRTITRGGDLQVVLEGIEEAKSVGLTPIKLNVVLIGGLNDDEIEAFVALTQDESIEVRFIELMPIGEVANWSKDNYVSNQLVLERVKALVPIAPKDLASPASYYQMPGAKGLVGLISPISCTFCQNCNRMRVTPDGKLKMCLHSDIEMDLKAALRKGENIEHIITKAIDGKNESHGIQSGIFVKRNMSKTGG